MLIEGSTAPEFTVEDHRHEVLSLRDQRGKWVLLWWYPKALTPGCTSCGQKFQAHVAEFHDLNCQILGVSYDSPEKNHEFASRHRFIYPLLTADYALAETYGAKRPDDDEWYDVPLRVSYLIDPDGIIRKAYKVLDPSTHPEQVLADLRALQAPKKIWKFWKR